MPDRPSPRRCRGGRTRGAEVPDAELTKAAPCTRHPAGAPPCAERDIPWLHLDESGRPLLAPTAAPVGTVEDHARAICSELGELLGRPVELLSVRANPLGTATVVSVATREVGRTGSVPRAGAAGGPRPSIALVEAIVNAHLGTESVLRAAALRLSEDGTIRSGLLVEAGVERWFGDAERSGPLAALAAGAAPDPLDERTRVLRFGATALAVSLADATAARLFDAWSRAVTRRGPVSSLGVGT